MQGGEGSLVVSHLNIRSLVPKLDDLQVLLQRYGGAHVLGLSETWLDGGVSDAEVSVSGFCIYRKDRDRRGGGIAVYVATDVGCVRRRDLEEEGIEALWLEIKMKKMQILVCNVYRPPNVRMEWIND